MEYILSGPLLGSCNITEASVRSNASEWERLGRRLASQLQFDHDAMDPVQKWVCCRGRATLPRVVAMHSPQTPPQTGTIMPDSLGRGLM